MPAPGARALLSLKVDEIHVDTFKGVVQLRGFVRSQTDIDKAVQVARGLASVKSIENDMRIFFTRVGRLVRMIRRWARKIASSSAELVQR